MLSVLFVRADKDVCDTILPGIPHRVMQDDVYKGMFIPKGSVIVANALCVLAASSVPIDAD
jgi:hypothetical protein